jgi:hypothetical protein
MRRLAKAAAMLAGLVALGSAGQAAAVEAGTYSCRGVDFGPTIPPNNKGAEILSRAGVQVFTDSYGRASDAVIQFTTDDTWEHNAAGNWVKRANGGFMALAKDPYGRLELTVHNSEVFDATSAHMNCRKSK